MKTPIRFLRENGDVYSGPPGVPVVRCAVSSSSRTIGTTVDMEFSDLAKQGCWALVDTGADQNVIDEVYAVSLGLKSVRQVPVYGVNGTTQQAVYQNTFCLLDTKTAVLGEFVSAPLKAQGRNYHMILGMSSISQGSLVMDFKSNVFELDFT